MTETIIIKPHTKKTPNPLTHPTIHEPQVILTPHQARRGFIRRRLQGQTKEDLITIRHQIDRDVAPRPTPTEMGHERGQAHEGNKLAIYRQVPLILCLGQQTVHRHVTLRQGRPLQVHQEPDGQTDQGGDHLEVHDTDHARIVQSA